MQQNNETLIDFCKLGIEDKLLSVLNRKNFVNPTPIQCQCIPRALEGKDIVGIAQTGTGKTLAFGIPLLQNLREKQGQALILVPTRELALQIKESLIDIGSSFGAKIEVIIGGVPLQRQIMGLKRKPHIVIATPGRLIDHLRQGRYSLKFVHTIILDEADRMFDIGFLPDIKNILSKAPKERQTLLFSATMPSEIAQVASCFMNMPIRIEVSPAGTSSNNIKQELYIMDRQSKVCMLQKVLNDNIGSALVFSRTKHGAKKITEFVRAMGHTAEEIHSNRSLAQRRSALSGFKSGKYRVLVATDIASRGIDVTDIAIVVNYDMPQSNEDYVHRIGRTGRAGKTGKAISFANPDQRGNIRQIERLIKKTIPILQIPKFDQKSVAIAKSFDFSRFKPNSSDCKTRTNSPSFGGRSNRFGGHRNSKPNRNQRRNYR